MQSTTAQLAIALHAKNSTITAQQVQNLLANVSTTFANIVYVTQVATSAKFKHVKITKVTQANVQLFSNINSATNVYVNAVKRSASKIASNNASNVANFTAQASYFVHTDCYSIVKHKTNNTLYLHAIYNNAKSVYFIDNVVATKQQVAQYLTASASAQLLQSDNTTHNITNNVTHNVVLRNIALSNIVSITANKQTITM